MTQGIRLRDGTDLRVQYVLGPRNGVERVRSGVILPRSFTARATGGLAGEHVIELTAEVQDRVLRCTGVSVRQTPGGPPVKTIHLRVPVDSILREAAAAAAVHVRPGEGFVKVTPVADPHAQAEVRRAIRTPRRRQPITDEDAQRAADAWLAHKHRRDRTVAAAESLNLSRSTFDRHRAVARERGYLKENQ